MPFDPNAAAQPGSGIFGLPFTFDEAEIILVPIPFDATTSYGGGTSRGPEAILNASMQVDLYDHQFGRTYERGIFMGSIPKHLVTLSRQTRALAKPIIDRGGATAKDKTALAKINEAAALINGYTYAAAIRLLPQGKIPGLVGGDHSTPFGFIRACAEHVSKIKNNKGLGILQVDAHMDFRDAFEGFTWSHASIMFNVLTRIPQVSKLVQVGIRDYGEGEREFGRSQKGRAFTHFDYDWSRRLDSNRPGEHWEGLCKEAIKPLPKHVYISFDIDGLDPELCPHTGTPVAGGLSFNRACVLLELLAKSGRTIVGFDLNEVSPGVKPNPNEPEWDANVGARLLYKLCGAAATARGS